MLKEKLRALPIDHVLRASVFGGIVADMMTTVYFMKYWEATQMGPRLWSLSLSFRGLSWQELDENFQSELTALLANTLGFMLFAFVAVNLFFYAFLLRKKTWAYHYAFGFWLTAGLLSFSGMLEGFPVGGLWEALNLLSLPLYLALAGVVWLRKSELGGHGFR